MVAEFWTYLSDWSSFDTWIVVTAALSAMACALPGGFLVLRRQSLLGDVLSHTVLLGIVLGFLGSHALLVGGWILPSSYPAIQKAAIFAGAIIIGMITAVLADAVKRIGRTESSAALGVVYTTLFAAGLLLIRLAADHIHIDADCVLFGMEETAVLDTVGTTGIPRSAIVNGGMLLVNGLLVLLFFKELRLSSFDPQLADTLGLRPGVINMVLLIATSATLVAAFESVGNILVIAMLIVPPATAFLLSDRLPFMVLWSLFLAGFCAIFGHIFALTVPPILFSRMGWPEVDGARTAGMMASVAGICFFGALLFSPRKGVLSKLFYHWQLQLRFIAEDVLGTIYRSQETREPPSKQALVFDPSLRWKQRLLTMWALVRMKQLGLVVQQQGEVLLTAKGTSLAEAIVRSHRLWESYMARHLQLPDVHLHATAEWVEHYLDPALREALESELDRPQSDPQGKQIPAEPVE
ncbi:MAG: metal ABC transporter permease [Planctomycetota bacterium]|nr:metal ABC transporter permease [Planctomycetota bacterium]